MRDHTDISKRKAPPRYAAHDVMGYLLDHRQDLSRSHSKIAECQWAHKTDPQIGVQDCTPKHRLMTVWISLGVAAVTFAFGMTGLLSAIAVARGTHLRPLARHDRRDPRSVLADARAGPRDLVGSSYSFYTTQKGN